MRKPLLLAWLLLPLMTLAQATNPAPQSIPYQQDFSALAHSATALPAGWQGWTLSGSPSGSFNVLPAAGDKALTANVTASSTANGILNYNGKVGFLNSGSVDNAVVLSINTSGSTNVSAQYTVMTLRNPYDSSANTRINEVVLQYRVGVTGNFISLPATLYRNNGVQQTTSGVTLPQNPLPAQVLLPAECENQPVVQLRWVNRQISGAGSRPSFAIDDIQIGGISGDVEPPVVDSLAPAMGDSAVQPGTPLKVFFNENIRKDTGTITISWAGGSQTLRITDPAITVSGNMLSIPASLRSNREYTVAIDSNTVQDSNGNGFTGLTNWHFRTGAQLLDFDFADCNGLLTGGFTQYSLTGDQLWACTTFGQTGNGVQINGYDRGAKENEDWLISPVFDLSGFNYPLLSFGSRSAFAGPALQLRVSTDYNGSGDPRSATWTNINGRFPETASDVWITSSGINLADFKGTDVYLAWVYISSPTLQASRWTIDDIHLVNADTVPRPSVTVAPAQLNFDYVPVGQHSEPQAFSFWGNDLNGPLTITAPDNWEISKDKVQYFSQLTYTTGGPDTAWTRFKPGAADIDFSGMIHFTSGGLDEFRVNLSGTSLRTLKVVNWNMEWFGHTSFGPADETLQQSNALKVLRSVNADIYALSEVVDTLRFKAIVDSMPGYRYTVSDFGSRADGVTSPQYDSAQKLAFIYRGDVVKEVRTYGVLRRGGSANAYNNWSSGRFPYLMEANVMLNNDTARMHFIVIHAKANTGNAADKIESWHRRKDGNKELKDSLDAQFPYKNVLVLGDFNDDFDRTITTELAPDTTTSYIDFKLDEVNYTPFTYELSLLKQRSTASFADMIDHAMGTNEVAYAYIPHSAKVLRSVESLIPSYAAATSDHFPVITTYDLRILAHPIVMQGFTVRESNGGVQLTWNTAREINNDRFIVERSADGRNFKAIDSVLSAAPNGGQSSYESFDGTVLPGYWHYRLKQVGKDGSVQYSGVQNELVLSREAFFRLICFILGRQLYVYLNAPASGPGMLQLIDMQGAIRYQGQMNFSKGMNYKQLDISNVPSGIYLLRVQSANKAEVKKILITR